MKSTANIQTVEQPPKKYKVSVDLPPTEKPDVIGSSVISFSQSTTQVNPHVNGPENVLKKNVTAQKKCPKKNSRKEVIKNSKTKTTKKREPLPNLCELYHLLFSLKGKNIPTTAQDETYARWAGVLGVLIRGKCNGFRKKELLRLSEDELILQIGKGNKVLGKQLYEKKFNDIEVMDIASNITADDLKTLIANNPNEGLMFISNRTGLGKQQLTKLIKTLFENQKINNFKELKDAILKNQIAVDDHIKADPYSKTNIISTPIRSKTNVVITTPINVMSTSIESRSNDPNKTYNQNISSTQNIGSANNSSLITNTNNLSCQGNPHLFFQSLKNTSTRSLPTDDDVFKRPGACNKPLLPSISSLNNRLENSSLLFNFPPIKEEPNQESEERSFPLQTPVLELNIEDLEEVIKTLRGKNYNPLANNCTWFCEEIIKYFQTSIKPTKPVTGDYSLDQFAFYYDVDNMALPDYENIKIKQDFPQKSIFRSQPSSTTQSKSAPKKIDTIHTAIIDRNSRLGALAPCDVRYSNDPNCPSIIYPDYCTQKKNTILNLDENLKAEALNPSGVSFGMVCLQACGTNIKDDVGHMLLYYSTPEKVYYIDAKEKPPIFTDLSRVKKFAESSKKIDNNTYGHLIYHTPIWPPLTTKLNVRQQTMKKN